MVQREAIILSTDVTRQSADNIKHLLQGRGVQCFDLAADHPAVLRSIVRDRELPREGPKPPVYDIQGTPAIILYSLMDGDGAAGTTQIVKYDTEEALQQLVHALTMPQVPPVQEAPAADVFVSDLNSLGSIEEEPSEADPSDRDFVATKDRGDLRIRRESNSPNRTVQTGVPPIKPPVRGRAEQIRLERSQ